MNKYFLYCWEGESFDSDGKSEGLVRFRDFPTEELAEKYREEAEEYFGHSNIRIVKEFYTKKEYGFYRKYSGL
jgi:hypothetical protein